MVDPMAVEALESLRHTCRDSTRSDDSRRAVGPYGKPQDHLRSSRSFVLGADGHNAHEREAAGHLGYPLDGVLLYCAIDGWHCDWYERRSEVECSLANLDS